MSTGSKAAMFGTSVPSPIATTPSPIDDKGDAGITQVEEEQEQTFSEDFSYEHDDEFEVLGEEEEEQLYEERRGEVVAKVQENIEGVGAGIEEEQGHEEDNLYEANCGYIDVHESPETRKEVLDVQPSSPVPPIPPESHIEPALPSPEICLALNSMAHLEDDTHFETLQKNAAVQNQAVQESSVRTFEYEPVRSSGTVTYIRSQYAPERLLYYGGAGHYGPTRSSAYRDRMVNDTSVAEGVVTVATKRLIDEHEVRAETPELTLPHVTSAVYVQPAAYFSTYEYHTTGAHTNGHHVEKHYAVEGGHHVNGHVHVEAAGVHHARRESSEFLVSVFSRDGERKEMKENNEHLLDYIQRVKLLEEEHQHLLIQISKLREKWLSRNTKVVAKVSSSTREEYTAPKISARLELNKAEIQVRRLREQVLYAREKISRVGRFEDDNRYRARELAIFYEQSEKELNHLNHRLAALKNEKVFELKETERLEAELEVQYKEFDAVALSLMDMRAQVDLYREEARLLKRASEEDFVYMRRALELAPFDAKEFFRLELEKAIRDIRVEFSTIAQVTNKQLTSWYNEKLSSFKHTRVQTEDLSIATKIREEESAAISSINAARSVQVELESKLRAITEERSARLYQLKTEEERQIFELESIQRRYSDIMAELQTCLADKVRLEGEIYIYRQLVKNESNRLGYVTVVHDEGRFSDWGVEEERELGGTHREVVQESTHVVNGHQQTLSSGYNSLAYGSASQDVVVSAAPVRAAQSYYSSRKVESLGTRTRRFISGAAEKSLVTEASADKTDSHGLITISDCDADGNYVEVHNHTSSDKHIDGWKIRRQENGGVTSFEYIFPSGTIIKAEQNLRVYSEGEPRRNSSDQVLFGKTWGGSLTQTTTLHNDHGELLATYATHLIGDL